jgi:hypothetical protein
MRLNHPLVIAAAVVAGIALIVLAVVYWAEPADSPPAWVPGHEAGSGHHHVKHGIASFLLGVALFVFAWFQTGKSTASSGPALILVRRLLIQRPPVWLRSQRAHKRRPQACGTAGLLWTDACFAPAGLGRRRA